MENLSLLDSLKGRVVEVIRVNINDKKNTHSFQCFSINKTEDELIISDELNDKNTIHINKEEVLEIEEDDDEGCIEIICLNNTVKISEM